MQLGSKGLPSSRRRRAGAELGGALVLVVGLGLSACSARPEARVPAASSDTGGAHTADRARCEVRGTPELWAGASLFAAPEGDRTIVELTGEAVDVEVRSLPRRERARVPVTLRTGGLALNGFVPPWALRLYLRDEVSLLSGALVIPSGARVRALGVGAADARVEPAHHDFAGIDAQVGCEHLTLDPPPRGHRPDHLGRWVHLRRARVAIYVSPGGEPVGQLVAVRTPTLSVREEQGDFVRVAYERGVRILAWMRRDDVAPGEGPDCDDCYGDGIGDALDRCPDELDSERTEDGCPEVDSPPPLVRIAAGTPVFLEPHDGGSPVGAAESAALVYVHERRGAWARVHARGWTVITPSGGGLWVRP